jgi:HK97 family phage portal protein
MKIKVRIARMMGWVAKQLNLTQFMTDYTFGYGDDQVKQDWDAHPEALSERQDANIATAVRLISSSISWLPIDIKRKEIDPDGATEYIDDNEHEANELINEPNQLHTTSMIFTHIAQSLILAGNAFLAIDKEGSTIKLWPLAPWAMSIKKDADGIPIGYIKDQNLDSERTYELEEIVHIPLYNINNAFYGRSGIQPLARHIMSDYYAELFNLNYFKNDATPATVFSPEHDIPKEENRKQLAASFNNRQKGVENKFKMFISPVKGAIESITPPLKDLAFAEMMKLTREKIYAVLGIPPSVGNVYEYANYANAKIQEETYWRHTLIPLIHLIDDCLTRQLIWRHFDKEHVLMHDISGVQALQADRLKQSQALKVQRDAGFITQNEGREELGRERVDEPAADELRSGAMPMDLFAQPQEDDGNGDDDDNGKGRTNPPWFNRFIREMELWSIGINPKKTVDDTDKEKYKIWKRFDNLMRREEIRYSRLIARYFREQKTRVIDKLNDLTQNGALTRTALYHITKHTKQLSDDDAWKIFDIELEKAELEAYTVPAYRQTVRRSALEALESFGIDPVFNINNPEVENMIELMVNRSNRINDTTYDAIKGILETGYDQQWTHAEIEREITELYRGFTRARARTIANTEMNTAVNGGAYEGYKQAGVEQVEWLASLDSHTRATHANLDGQRAEVGSHFVTMYGNNLRYPGDPSAPAAEVINCRCATIPVVEDE